MNDHPLVSIITVTYNAAATLPATLKSVAAQTGCTAGVDYEYLIIDGLSKDNTVEIAGQSSIEGMKIHSGKDSGIYDAMNKGIDMASGDYLIFLNAGDTFHKPTTLQSIVETIRFNNMPGIVYGQTEFVDSERRSLGPRHLTAPRELTYKSFKKGMVVCHQAFVAMTRIAPHFNTAYRYSADYDWCLQCLQHSRRNVYIDDVIIDFLAEGTTSANRIASLKERFRIMCYYYGTLPTIMRHLTFLPRFIKSSKRLNKAKKSYAQS